MTMPPSISREAHTALPPIPAFPDDRPVAFLVRHAERPPIPASEPGNNLPLTAAGAAASVELGAALAPRLGTINTSPVRRCRETAVHICTGAGRNIALCDDRLLGDPGVFVADPELAWSNWERLGHRGVLEHLVAARRVSGQRAAGQRILPGMREPRTAARTLLAHLADALTGPVRVHLFITHDAVLAPFLAHLLDLRDPDSWPRFLEGAVVCRSERGVHIRYRDHEGIAP